MKNVHGQSDNPELPAATELILFKYKESNLTNLNFFTYEGLNKISLEHIFIKNNSTLYGRYNNVLNLSILPSQTNLQPFYRKYNNFFKSKSQGPAPFRNRLKTAISKLSVREDQKRFKYVEIINFAKACVLPFEFIEQKRKRQTKRTFVVPNRHRHLH